MTCAHHGWLDSHHHSQPDTLMGSGYWCVGSTQGFAAALDAVRDPVVAGHVAVDVKHDGPVDPPTVVIQNVQVEPGRPALADKQVVVPRGRGPPGRELQHAHSRTFAHKEIHRGT